MNVLAAGAIIFDAIKEKTHALAERTELQGDKAKNNSERNAVMVRGRQLEELAPALLLPLFSSLTTFLFSTTTTKFSEQE